jgi:hypothetical protein
MEKLKKIRPIDVERKAFTYIGRRYFCCRGKCSFKPRSVGLPIYLILFIYNFSHSTYLLYKYITTEIYFIIIMSTSFFLFIVQMFQSLYTAFTDPGAFLPNYRDDKSNNPDTNLMLATVQKQDYFLKLCKTCKIAKDLRVFHCKECGLCILRHDHHCPWLSTCIGIHNNRKFIMLLIINLIFFAYNPIVLLLFLFLRFQEEDKDIVNQADRLCVLLLIILNSFLFLFHGILILSHSLYIGTGQTTSEKIKRNPNTTNPFCKDSCCENMDEFWKCPMKYRENIKYNENASKYINTNILISDYLSDNFDVINNKVISKTYMYYGFNYANNNIELIDQSNMNNDNDNDNDINDDDETGNDSGDKLEEEKNISSSINDKN